MGGSSSERVLEMPSSREGILGDDNGHVCPAVILAAEEVSVCNHSLYLTSNCDISTNKTAKIFYSITVLFIVSRICEPSFIPCIVIIYIVYLVVCTILYFCLLLPVSPIYSAREYLVSSMSSGSEGGVFTYGRPLSAGAKNRFRAVNRVRQAGLVGSMSQQTTVLGCCDFLRRDRAGKCWNLTGTGTHMWFIFILSSWLIRI
jgi:hypothetical protein